MVRLPHALRRSLKVVLGREIHGFGLSAALLVQVYYEGGARMIAHHHPRSRCGHSAKGIDANASEVRVVC
jgi:hypothetical protein